MKRLLLFVALMSFSIAIFAQTHTLPEYFGKIDVVSTALVGTVSLILTEVFNWKAGTTKTNALIIALVIAAAISVVLVGFGVPTNFGFSDVFTAASILFALWRKLQGMVKKE